MSKQHKKNRVSVMLFGTFDILHLGHIELFQQARTLGTYLLVVLARDTRVEAIKGKLPIHTEDERREILNHIDLVDEVFLGDTEDVYKVIELKKPDVIALGYDQKIFVDKLEEEIKKIGLCIDIVRLKPHVAERYKSGKLREHL